jgi:hypothetical protein
LGQERVHGDKTTVEAQALSERLAGGALLGCVVHGMVGARHAPMVDQRCEQLCPWRSLCFGTS